ncbi:hypothetical protein ACFLR8_02645 [Bacteroidota bacterium]
MKITFQNGMTVVSLRPPGRINNPYLNKSLLQNLDPKGPGTYEYEVVGESHYQKELNRICGGRTYEGHEKTVQARLIHDDNNPHDAQAVRIEIEGLTVGHLNRDDARNYRKQLADSGNPGIDAVCSAIIVGGWDRGDGDTGYFGVKLDIPTIE